MSRSNTKKKSIEIYRNGIVIYSIVLTADIRRPFKQNQMNFKHFLKILDMSYKNKTMPRLTCNFSTTLNSQKRNNKYN